MLIEKRYSSKEFNSTLLQWLRYRMSLSGYFHSYFINHVDISQFKSSCLKGDGKFIYSKPTCLSTSIFLTRPHLHMTEHLHKHELWPYHMPVMGNMG